MSHHWKATIKGPKNHGTSTVVEHLKKTNAALDSVIVWTRFGATSDRTGNENGKIAGIQKSQGRNPWYATVKEMTPLKKLIRKQFSIAIAQRARAGTMVKTAHVIGKELIKIYQKHMQAGKNKSGSFKPITKSAVARKKAKHGYIPKILFDSRQLYNSMTYTVKKAH